jgi:hypothetical protein
MEIKLGYHAHMINFSFTLSNPFYVLKRYKNIWVRNWRVAKHTNFELELYKGYELLGFSLSLSAKRNHAGIFISVDLLGYTVSLDLHDTRHWDVDTKTWHTQNTTGE